MPADTISTLARLHGRVFYPRFDSAMLDENLAAFGINPSIPLSSMSLGQRKAIAAYAPALRADILLLDEPANGLDIGSRDILRSLMARCVEPGQTVIVSTHTTADLQPLLTVSSCSGRAICSSAIPLPISHRDSVSASTTSLRAKHCSR